VDRAKLASSPTLKTPSLVGSCQNPVPPDLKVAMTHSQRVLVLAQDVSLLQNVQSALRKFMDPLPLCARFDGLRNHVNASTNGVILLLAGSPADRMGIRQALQELMLLGLPPQVVLVEAPGANATSFGACEERISGRIAWPASAADLQAVIKDQLTRGAPFLDPGRETIPARIARRLLAYTPSLEGIVESLAIAASHDVTVLLDGETGTGKTFLARLIHDCSARAANRFLVVACGALAPNLIESEFFGHAKGAFTGADAAKLGKFAAVGQGTLLLDEIDVLGMEHQANLLRVIETGEYEPVGSNETQICVARIIAATNWNLEEAVGRGTFRRDLYYRLNVMPFHLPPLRERTQDIEPLVRGLVARFAAKFNKDIVRIHPDTIRTLSGYDWPGNIRQLENVVQQAVLLSSGTELVVKNLSPIVQNRCPSVFVPRAEAGALEQSRQSAERVSILRALETANYCRTRAARALGISRVTLYKKMRQYGLLARPAFVPRAGAASGA
jgi:DNA-binding NtrC family response regulator